MSKKTNFSKLYKKAYRSYSALSSLDFIGDPLSKALAGKDFSKVHELLSDMLPQVAASLERAQNKVQEASILRTEVTPKPAMIPSPPGKAKSIVQRVLGYTFGIPLSIGSFASTVYQWGGSWQNFLVANVAVLYPMTAFALYWAWKGTKLSNARKRYYNYAESIFPTGVAELNTLAITANQSLRKTIRDLEYMMRQGFFTPGILDRQQGIFVAGKEAVARYHENLKLQGKKQSEQAQADTISDQSNPRQLSAEAVFIKEEGEKYLALFQQSRTHIQDKEVSLELEQLEKICTNILTKIQKSPERYPEIRRFMQYYLPMTAKLISSYEELEGQPVQGENILQTKNEIKQSLTLIRGAFSNLLDSLFQKNSLEIHSEISAMKNMFHTDGLTENTDEEEKENG